MLLLWLFFTFSIQWENISGHSVISIRVSLRESGIFIGISHEHNLLAITAMWAYSDGYPKFTFCAVDVSIVRVVKTFS